MIIKNPLRSGIQRRNGIPILPGDFPGVGHMPSLLFHLPEAMREGERAVGPLFWVRSFANFWVLIWTERESFELLKNKTTSSVGADMTNDPTNFVGDSMITLDGAPHQHIRSAVKGPFTPRGIEVSQVGKVSAEMIEARVRDWTRRGEITLLEETQELTLNIIFRIMGISVPDLPEWRRQYREMFLGAYPLQIDFPGFPLYRAKKAQAWVNRRLMALVEETRRKGAEDSSRSLLASMVHGKDDDGQGLSDKELVENLRLLVLAGHETTASTMAWVMITLARRPDLWEALVEEADKAPSIPISPADIRSYPVADGLFREAVRLYAPVGFIARKTMEWLTVREHRIPPGTLMGACLSLLSRDPELYPDPDRFDPGRWKGRAPTPLETCQFGGGPHFCLGYHLAWMEMVQFSLTVARELRRAGLRPGLGRSFGLPPRPIYFPLTHPPRGTKIQLH